MHNRSECCCGLDCIELIGLAIILALFVINFGCFDQAVLAAGIAIIAILSLS